MIKRTEWRKDWLDECSWRVKVIGGWVLYTIGLDSHGVAIGITSVFLADKEHEWEIISPQPVLNIVEMKVPECLL